MFISRPESSNGRIQRLNVATKRTAKTRYGRSFQKKPARSSVLELSDISFPRVAQPRRAADPAFCCFHALPLSARSREGIPTKPAQPVSSVPRMLAVVALLASGFCLRATVALRPLKWIDGLTLPDDAYLSLTIARNVGRGLGPHYGTSYTNGFQPLWVFLTAPLYAWRPLDLEGNVHAALLILAGCDTLLAALVCLQVWRWTRNSQAPAVVAAAWAMNPYSVRTSLCGLEASLSAMLAVLVLLLLDRERDNTREFDRRRLLVLGIALGFAILARIDNGFLALTVALFLVPWHTRPLSRALRGGLARILPVAAAAAAVTLPWLVYSYHYTGDLYPISGRAVRLVALGDRVVKGGALEGYRGVLLGEAWAWFFQSHAFLLNLIAGLLLVLVLFFRSDLTSLGPVLKRTAPSLLWGALLFFVYPLHILAHWFFPRYQYPILIPLLLVVGSLFAFLASRPRLGRFETALTAAVVVGSLVFHPRDTRSLRCSSRSGRTLKATVRSASGSWRIPRARRSGAHRRAPSGISLLIFSSSTWMAS